MRVLDGTSSGAFAPILGEATFEPRPFYDRGKRILVKPGLDWGCLGYAGCVASDMTGHRGLFPDTVFLRRSEDMSQIHAGDVLRLDGAGRISVLWEKDSAQNAFLLTEACNCRCLMCPQPPRKHDPFLLREAQRILDMLRGQEISHIGITGGEPTLLGKKFVAFLQRCTSEHPNAVINVLTNGKAFADKSFARDVAEAASSNTLFCISLHAEIDRLHDAIVGKHGSFQDTQRGIYALAEQGARLEIRHVVSRMNYRRLSYFAEHLYNYFPFCVHYAFMGMEVCGHAGENMERLYIPPHEYREELAEAVIYLHRRGLSPSVYNIPLCMCDPRIREFARQSISAWKNTYPSLCDACARRGECAGFFSTSIKIPLEHLQPITEHL